jgi:hypothetical protein
MVFKGQDAWRRHPLFQGLWKSPFPGFRNAVVLYGIYYGLEKLILAPPSHKSAPH